MTEYIDRKAVLLAMRDRLSEARAHQDEYGDCADIVYGEESMFNLVRGFPKAGDVAPVRHARWIEEDGYQVCSNCGEEHSWGEYRANYCEDCGAKME